MDDAEFFAKVKPKRFTSLEGDFKAWRKEFLKDEKRNAIRKTGRLSPEPVEITYDFKKRGGNSSSRRNNINLLEYLLYSCSNKDFLTGIDVRKLSCKLLISPQSKLPYSQFMTCAKQ